MKNYAPMRYRGMKKKKPQKKLVASTKLIRTTLKEDIGKMLFEVGRMALGSMVIGVLLRGETPDDILLIAGTAVVAVCFSLSVILGKREIKTDKTPFRRRKRSKR
jgi:hypothetical protein